MNSRIIYSLGELENILGAKSIGDAEYNLQGLASLNQAREQHVTFISSDKSLDQLATCKAGAVVLKEIHSDLFPGNRLIVSDPYMAYALLIAVFYPRPKRKAGITSSASVSESAIIAKTTSIGAHCSLGENVVIGENCEIYPGVVIAENTRIGNDCLIYPNVSLYSDTVIGDNVIIHSGCVIGSDGFGFARKSQGWEKIHQRGNVVIGNNVEIGASTTIDRGSLDSTVIEDGVIIDNQVHIAHNVVVGAGSALAGCVGIAGSAKLGKNCMVAGAVAINGHIEIADGTQFHGGTIVTKGNKEKGIFSSTPPMQEVRQWRKSAVRYRHLDDMAKRIKELEKALDKDNC